MIVHPLDETSDENSHLFVNIITQDPYLSSNPQTERKRSSSFFMPQQMRPNQTKEIKLLKRKEKKMGEVELSGNVSFQKYKNMDMDRISNGYYFGRQLGRGRFGQVFMAQHI